MATFAIGDRRPVIGAGVWIAPSADLIGEVILGAQSSVWFNAVIRADNSTISVGPRSNVQENAVLHSDADAPCSVGQDCTIGHHAILHGCNIADRVLVGIRATILDRAQIAEDCVVGAGALVTHGKTFAPGHLILGVPAVAVRTLTHTEIAAIRHGAAHYVKRAAQFGRDLAPCR